MEDTNVIEIERILKIAWEKKFYIALLLLIFFVAGYYYSYYCVQPLYKSASTILLVKSQEEESKEITQSDISLNQKLVSTYGEIMTSPKVVGKVISNLNLNMSEKELAKSISVKSVNSTEILKISVSNKDARVAKKITDELIEVFHQEVKEMYNINNVNIIGEAQIEKTPYNINHIRDIGIFIALGIAASCGMILVIYLFDTTIKIEEDIEKYIGLNVLTSIPIANPKLVAGAEDNELIAQSDPKSPISEVFRTLRTNIAFTQAGKNIKNILVTSSNPGEGKSWVSSNLAIIFAQANKKTILIDADMRKGRQHYIFEARNRIGLSNFLASAETGEDIEEIADYVQTTKIPNLHIMTGGNRPPNPSELLSSDGKMKKLLDMLNSIYDVVIIDGTPSDIVSDSIIISNIVDSVIIVTASKQTKIKSTQKLKRLLETSNAKIGGVVLNKVAVSAKVYRNKYYYSDTNNTLKKPEEHKKQEIETVEQLIARASKNKTNKDALNSIKIDEKEFLETNFANTKYQDEESGEFKSQINSIGNEISNIKQLFMKILVDNQNQIKETAINQSEMQLLKEKLDDLKTICTSVNRIKSEDIVSKVRDEIDRLEAVYNISQSQDPEYAKSIENKLENMKELYYKSMEYENSVSTRTIDKIESIKEVIATLKEYINEKLNTSINDESLQELKRELVNIENDYEQKLEERLKSLEQSILENVQAKKAEEIKEYIKEIQDGYSKELENKFTTIEDTIAEKYNASGLAEKLEQIRNEYNLQLQAGWLEIQNCIKDNNSADKLAELLNEMQNANSLELAHKVDEIKDFYSGELIEKVSNQNIDLSVINEKFDEIKEYNSNEFKEKLQNIYNLYTTDLDESVDQIKIFETERFEELKNFEIERFNDVKDKIEEMQDRYSVEIDAKIGDVQEHYVSKLDEMQQINQEQLTELKEKMDKLYKSYSEDMDKNIENLQKLQTSNISQRDIETVKDEISKLRDFYDNTIQNEFKQLQRNLEQKNNSLEDEIFTMKQELIRIRKELEHKSENSRKPVAEKPGGVYRYNDYEDIDDRKSTLSRKEEMMNVNKENKKPATAASSISQILKF